MNVNKKTVMESAKELGSKVNDLWVESYARYADLQDSIEKMLIRTQECLTHDFKEGDVVQLRSGGPKMTIGYMPDDHPTITCIWFDGNTRCSAYFNKESLIYAKE